MNKLLLSFMALATLTLTVSSVEAARERVAVDGDGQYQRVEHYCGHCNMPKPHCHCPKEICQKEVVAIEEVPLEVEYIDESYCEEGTTERVNPRTGKKECVKVIAHEEIKAPICKRKEVQKCPTNFTPTLVSGGHAHQVREPKKTRAGNVRRRFESKPSVDMMEAAPAA